MSWNSQRAGGAGPPVPSLNALWTFDAVARHKSMTRAAAELSVTQTAVSHQIRRLEAELGYALFQRRGGRTELTPEGATWAQQLSALFSRLRAVNQQLRVAKPSTLNPLSISIIPSLATRWLVPRLGDYLTKKPGCAIACGSYGTHGRSRLGTDRRRDSLRSRQVSRLPGDQVGGRRWYQCARRRCCNSPNSLISPS